MPGLQELADELQLDVDPELQPGGDGLCLQLSHGLHPAQGMQSLMVFFLYQNIILNQYVNIQKNVLDTQKANGFFPI